ncbi:hypothetical protein AB0I10_18330 [Streptomyces sp. NPDC050636]|uniref:hypothetical protein n=1 Tax=Streptomyces sp. NPDC050636 TaxID=3154510 RepID=UPI003423BF8E
MIRMSDSGAVVDPLVGDPPVVLPELLYPPLVLLLELLLELWLLPQPPPCEPRAPVRVTATRPKTATARI